MLYEFIRGLLGTLLKNEYGRGLVVFSGIVLMLVAPLLLFLVICYVFYKPGKTNGLEKIESHGGENPLVLLKYEWWRIAWALYVPLVPAFMACGVASSSPLNDASIRGVIITKIFAPIGLMGSAWLIVDMLLMKDITLYKDKIVATYRLFKSKEVIISKANYSFINRSIMRALIIRNTREPWYLSCFLAVTIWDLNLCRAENVNKFISVLSEITGRDIEELTSNTWKPIRLMKDENNVLKLNSCEDKVVDNTGR